MLKLKSMLCVVFLCTHFFVQPHIGGEIDLPEGCESIPQEDYSSPLDTELSATVNNSVNVITGLYHDFDVDFMLPGASSLSLQRAYVSTKTHRRGPLGRGWCHNYFGIACKAKSNKLMIMDSFGSTHCFNAYKHNKFGLDPNSIDIGATNCGSGKIRAAPMLLTTSGRVISRRKPAYLKNLQARSKLLPSTIKMTTI